MEYWTGDFISEFGILIILHHYLCYENISQCIESI